MTPRYVERIPASGISTCIRPLHEPPDQVKRYPHNDPLAYVRQKDRKGYHVGRPWKADRRTENI
jgi:hypothetical protein